jgi:hypothetical protein
MHLDILRRNPLTSLLARREPYHWEIVGHIGADLLAGLRLRNETEDER